MKFFETVTPPSKRRERQTTPSIAGQTSLRDLQIAFSSKGEVPNRNKTNSSIKSNTFHSKYVCFGGRKTPEERKFASSAFLMCLCPGPRQRALERWFHPQLSLVHLNLSAQIQMDQHEDETTLQAPVAAPGHQHIGKAEVGTLRQIFRPSRVLRPPKHTYLE